MDRRTKSCEVTVHLKNGECLQGRYHVDGNTSSSIRPSDALRESTNPYLLLTDVRAEDGHSGDPRSVVLVRADAVGYIELPDQSWD